MNQNIKMQKPILPPDNRSDANKEPFNGDSLKNREEIANLLTSYLDRLRVGAVLAIDAPWGEGKTWFGREWEKKLKAEGHQVISINAFAQDYIEDPFLLIAAEITKIIDNKKNKIAFKKNTIEVAKALASNTPNLVINLISRAVFKTSSEEIIQDNKDLFNDISDLTKNIANEVVEKKLQDYEKEKDSFVKFRVQLEEFCKKQIDHPVVIIIDELDRCKPTFAVQLIERIKHLFDVPNLIFVLLINRKQLERAIQGVYGSETDAQTYLGKFINLFFCLPKNTSLNYLGSSNPIQKFVTNIIKLYEFEPSEEILFTRLNGGSETTTTEFIRYLSMWATCQDMSLREIEHACALFVLSNSKRTALISYLIMLKIKHQDLYKSLAKDEESAHDKAITLCQKINYDPIMKSSYWIKGYLGTLVEMHELRLTRRNKDSTPNLKEHGIELYNTTLFDPNTTFQKAFSVIDLPIQL